MSRTPIPPKTKETVLKEFKHRCAICGRHDPHVHHIDGDATNHDIANLLPLCPNCHLTDQHNPTAPVDPRKIALFRKFKDPTILTPQFEPLFRRLTFVLEEGSGAKDTTGRPRELIRFIMGLHMGEFYAGEIDCLLPPFELGRAVNDGSFCGVPKEAEDDPDSAYRQQLSHYRERILEFVVELLRYQNWQRPK